MKPVKHAFFDYCETIYPGQSLQGFISKLHQNIAPQTARATLQKKLLSLPIGSKNYKKYAFASLKGSEKSLIENVGKDFFMTHLREKHYQFMLGTMQSYFEKGFQVTIVSGGCTEYLHHMLDYNFIDNVIATSLIYDTNERLIGFPSIECLGAQKIRFIERKFKGQIIDWSSAIFYTDSESDLPLLKKVGKGFVVGPSSSPPPWTMNQFDYVTLDSNCLAGP